jgi:AhpD family alkylhydroperoxidase
MEQRMALGEVAPDGYKAVMGLERYARATVDPTLYELVKLRASVLNGCAYCVDMHSREALAAGESMQRLFAVSAWREAPFFTAPERAALELTDAITQLGPHGVSDSVWNTAASLWSQKELADLVIAISTINVWNRIAVSTHMQAPRLD